MKERVMRFSLLIIILAVNAWNNPDSNTSISIEIGSQLDPAILCSEEGGETYYYIVWWGQQPTNQFITGIYAQKLDINGNNLWATNGIPVVQFVYSAGSPQVGLGMNGNIYIAYVDQENGNGAGNIKFTGINSDGAQILSPVAICNNIFTKQRLQMIKTSDNMFGISWREDVIENGQPITRLFAQKVSSSGTIQWTVTGNGAGIINGLRISWLPDEQRAQVTLPTNDGGLRIPFLWLNPDLSTPSDEWWEVWDQKISSIGQLEFHSDGHFVADCDVVYPSQLSATIDSFNNCWITWESEENGNLSVMLQGVNNNEQDLLPGEGINILTETSTLFANQNQPSITCFEAGPFSIPVIAFVDDRNIFGTLSNIFLTSILYNNTGGAFYYLTPLGIPVCTAPGVQQNVKIKKSSTPGVVYTVWLDARNGTDWDIYAQKTFVLGGHFWGLNGAVITNIPGSFQGFPHYQGIPGKFDFVIKESVGLTAVWQDARNHETPDTPPMIGGNWDIFAQLIPD
ncbi:MAG: hypothetical protein HY606_07375 [Planctomycetes bacterium]|nr:hypothetical protein [Planctomycetota bacterium]